MVVKRLIITVVAFFFVIELGAQTLSDFSLYSDNIVEDTKRPDDWTHPQFDDAYKPQNFLHVLQDLFAMPRSNIISLDRFKDLVADCVRIVERKKRGCTNGCESFTLSVTPDTKCIVWGPLFGAFHSLIRCLQDLKKRNIIDNSLRIQGDYYCVFLGDVCGRAPYSLETLIVVLSFLKANPDRVIYLVGEQEKHGYWRNFNTKQQFKSMRWYHECAGGLDKLFDQLYRDVNIVLTTDKKKQLLCSYSGFDQLEMCVPLNQNGYNCPPERDTLAVVQADTPLHQVHIVKSLLDYGYDFGAFVWSLFSSPTAVHQHYRDYYYDAYSQINFGKTIGSSSIEVHQRHVVKDDSFYVRGPYNLVSGIINGPSIEKKDLYVFGSTLAMSGAAEVHGTFIQEGILALLGELNKKGGVHNKLMRPFLFDDGYQPLFARRNVRYLLKNYDVDVLICPTGSPTLAFYRAMLEKPDVAVLFPSTGAPIFYNSAYKGLVLGRVPYTTELDRLTRHIVKRHGVRRFAFFYQDDAFGRPATEQAIKVLKEFGITDVLKIPYSRDQIIFDEAARKVLDYKPDVIGMVAIPKPAIEFLRKVGTHNLMDKVVFVTSILNEDTFKRFMRNRGLSYTVAHCLPDPRAQNLEIIRDYQKIMDLSGLPYDDFTLEGYLAMDLFKHVLEGLKPPFTKEKILQKIESWRDYYYKGLTLNFDPETRQVLDFFWIETVQFI